MTNAQEDAFQKIKELMREHFSAGVIVVNGEVSEDDKADDVQSIYHGGYATSIGLLELGKLQVWRKGRDVEPE